MSIAQPMRILLLTVPLALPYGSDGGEETVRGRHT
jgi:hypothetical protein